MTTYRNTGFLGEIIEPEYKMYYGDRSEFRLLGGGVVERGVRYNGGESED
jgi:hypothetical protein